ncbi:MAG: molybdopterin-dependent oxidoreductase [Microthrixaceae bacterium]
MAALSLFAAACSSDEEKVESSTTTAEAGADAATNTTENPYGSATPIDPPAPGEAILTVTGPKGEEGYSLEQLAALSPQTVTITEPFVKKTQVFTAIPMESLFTPAGITGNQMVDTTAINDYEYLATAESFVDGKALLAYELDGNPIPYDQGGPVRIIFADDAPGASNLDAWNWSLRSISAN